MMNLFTIASQGAQAAQNQLSVAAGNIANQQTAGYSRQQISQSATVVSQTGSGVKTSDAARVTDQHINQALWQSQTAAGYYQSMNSWGTSLEQVISTDSTQPGTLLTTFFNSLSALTSQPDSTAYRQQLLSSAAGVASGLSQTAETLAGQQTSLTDQQSAATQQITQISAEIAALNKQIQRAGSGAESNTLQDQRDQQVKSLSSLMSVSVEKTAEGSYRLTAANGATLVDGDQAATATSVQNDQGVRQLRLTIGQQTSTVTENVGGQLGALYDYQQQVLSPLQTRVSGLMQSVSDQVNSTLAKGYDLNGQSGGALFSVETSDSGVMSLKTTALQASELGLSAGKDSPANGDNLQALLALQTATGQAQSSSLADQASGITSSLALANSQSSSQLTAATAVNDQWQQQRDNLSGVNKDEEAVNLQTYLQSYQANMKVMTVGNQLFADLLNAFS